MPRRPAVKRVKKSIKSSAAPRAIPPAPRPDPKDLDVVLYPDPVLLRPAAEVPAVDEYVHAVIAQMKQLMEKYEGVGLAAPQVGLPLRLFVYADTGKAADARVLINPRITAGEGEEEGEEGCLSLPDVRAKIVRNRSVQVEALDEQGQPVTLALEEYVARIVQHEYDHLNGILITDRMSPVAKMAARKKLRELEAEFGGRKKK